jgi:hypothetical protein
MAATILTFPAHDPMQRATASLNRLAAALERQNAAMAELRRSLGSLDAACAGRPAAPQATPPA